MFSQKNENNNELRMPIKIFFKGTTYFSNIFFNFA